MEPAPSVPAGRAVPALHEVHWGPAERKTGAVQYVCVRATPGSARPAPGGDPVIYVFQVPLWLLGREGNGNLLQCSCLENPRDGGAWWAVVYGVSQSWTRLSMHAD